MQKCPLSHLAYARSGDKGNSANIGVMAKNKACFDQLKKELTEDVVKEFFKQLNPKRVIRYELPNLESFNFILEGVLAGGGSCSLRLDSQGKALGQALLTLPLEESNLNLVGPPCLSPSSS